MLTKIAKILVDPPPLKMRRCQKFKLFSPISPPSPMLVNQSYAFIFSQLEQQVSLKFLNIGSSLSWETDSAFNSPHIILEGMICMVAIQICFQCWQSDDDWSTDWSKILATWYRCAGNFFVRALEWEFKSSKIGLTSNSNERNESSSSHYGWISASDLYVIAEEMCQNCAHLILA